MTNDNTYRGTTTVPNTTGVTHPQPSRICPGCGRCKDCGRPYETIPVAPFNPWPGYPQPYVGDWPPLPGTTWISTSGTSNMTMPSGGFQVWN